MSDPKDETQIFESPHLLQRQVSDENRVPVLVAWQDLLWVVGGTMVVCLGATLFPARKAVALDPAEGLRYG